uniref:Leukotriene A4 hydrolase n=1 Tax=Astyanax mexicanus TaxID=7994 RepID=A0A3B1KDS6_ASTMX
MAPVTDHCSFSSFSKCLTRHLNLSLQADFSSRVLRGRVALTVEVLEDKFSSLTLDTKDLKIFKVSANGQAAKFELGAQHGFKGSPLDITLPFELSRGQHVIVEVEYETSPSASALQWLSPAQTAGKKHPYLFSQCQATHCRTMVPNLLTQTHIAVRDGQEADPTDSSRVIYRFRQPVPMPSYLIALVVGALESREIGPRSRVWSEKEHVDQGAFEFTETETMLKTAESLAGPYVWGQYDLLVLPPSFPYGGMENPCLTFVTPTLLVSTCNSPGVIAHEISHSWTGNLVTNKTWEHFWLNEGHTVYLERMIGRVHQFGANNAATNLVVNLEGVNPDECFSCVPYEKGFALLYHLEELMGGPEVFMGFVKSYIQMFAYSSVTTEQWKDYLFTYFKDKVDILNKVDWNGWMYTPGMPPFKPQYDTTLADACNALAQRWTKAKDADLSGFSEADIKQLSSHQLIEFLALLLLQVDPLPTSHVKRMQEVYKFNSINNSEIRCRWLRLCVKSEWEDAVPLALKMATEQGRMKFTRPLFRDVYNFAKFRDEAVKVFKEHRNEMHSVTAMLVAKDLKVDQSTGL